MAAVHCMTIGQKMMKDMEVTIVSLTSSSGNVIQTQVCRGTSNRTSRPERPSLKVRWHR